MTLLYRTAEWHAFTKLRMHSDCTLAHLKLLTKEFGLLMRQFRDLTCSQFKTMELPHEVAAQNQRAQPKTSSRVHTPTLPSVSESPPAAVAASSTSLSQKSKTLNLLTPKFHSLGDYASTIQMFSCTDGFSTQVV